MAGPQILTAEQFEAYRQRLEEEAGAAGGDPGAPLAPPPAPTRDSAQQPPSLSEFGGNILRSGARLGGDILQMGAHPIETGKALGGLAVGAVEKLSPPPSLAPGDPPELLSFLEESKAEREAPFDAVTQHMKQRYGSLEAASRTAYEDPVGFAADLSAVMSVGGAALRAPSAALRMGGVAEASRVGKIAELAAGAGRSLRGSAQLMDPIQLAAKVATPLANKTLWVLETAFTEIPGLFGGTGGGPLKKALGFMGGEGASSELTAAMRNRTSEISVLEGAKSALARLKEQRGMSYRAKLAELPRKMKLNLDPIREALPELMKQYGLRWARAPAKQVKGPRGTMISQQQPLKLDFSRSTITSSADQGKIRRLINDINDWGRETADVTPLGVDTLRRRIDDLYTEGGQARAMTQSLAQKTRDVLDDVPGYTEMTREYSELSGMIREIESELSLGSKASRGASLRKLMSTFSDRTGYREQMLEVLDQFVVDNLGQQLAGLNLRPLMPTGLVGKSVAMSGAAAVAAGLVDPQVLLFIAMSSPRVMGEVMAALSTVKRGARALRDVGTIPAQILTEPSVYRPAAYASELPPPPTIGPSGVSVQMIEMGDEQ